MTLQAEGHAERLGMVHFFHLINPTMAFDATDAPVDVNGVVEIHVIGCLVNTNPGNGISGTEHSVTVQVFAFRKESVPVRVFAKIRFANGLEQRGIRLDILMTRHANVGGRDACVRRLVDRVVTIPAVQAQLAGMKLVIVGYGLRGLIPDSGVLLSCVVSDAGNKNPTRHAQSNDKL